MKFAIMVWVSGQAHATSIFGVLDKENPGKLPMLGSKGHWADYRSIDGARFIFDAEAKKAIAAEGYYLMGASLTVEQAFGPTP